MLEAIARSQFARVFVCTSSVKRAILDAVTAAGIAAAAFAFTSIDLHASTAGHFYLLCSL